MQKKTCQEVKTKTFSHNKALTKDTNCQLNHPSNNKNNIQSSQQSKEEVLNYM